MMQVFNQIDDKDKRIIKILQDDSGVSHSEVARELNMSQPAIRARILKLERKGIIKTQTGLNLKNAGLPIMTIDLDCKNYERIANKARYCPFIINVIKKTGKSNVQIMATAKNMDVINHFMEKCLRNDDTVDIISNSVVVGMLKEYIIPINIDVEQYDAKKCPIECPYQFKSNDMFVNQLKQKSNIPAKIYENKPKYNIKKHINQILKSITDIAGCDGIGLKLHDEDSNIKYYVWENGVHKVFINNTTEDMKNVCLFSKLVNKKVPERKRCQENPNENNPKCYIFKNAKRVIKKYKKETEDDSSSNEICEFYCEKYNNLVYIPIQANSGREYGNIMLAYEDFGGLPEDKMHMVNTILNFFCESLKISNYL